MTMDPDGMNEREWHDVIDSMEEVGPYYDRINQLITFGLADRWRAEAAKIAEPDDVVLELGSGPGSFARMLSSRKIFCVEPSSELARASRNVLDPDRMTLLRGVGERIPLAESSIDKVFCVFSFRDFYDRPEAVGEMHRVLKEGGEVVILEVSKPPDGPLAKLLEMHVKHVVQRLAKMSVPSASRERWARDPYRTFIQTYEGYGSTAASHDLLVRGGFDEVTTKYLELKGATMTRGKKPWKSTS